MLPKRSRLLEDSLVQRRVRRQRLLRAGVILFFVAPAALWIALAFSCFMGWEGFDDEDFWSGGITRYVESQSPAGLGRVVLRKFSTWDGDSFTIYVQDEAVNGGGMQTVKDYNNMFGGFEAGRFVWSQDGSLVAHWDKYPENVGNLQGIFTSAYDFREHKAIERHGPETDRKIRTLLTQRGGVTTLKWSSERKAKCWKKHEFDSAADAKTR